MKKENFPRLNILNWRHDCVTSNKGPSINISGADIIPHVHGTSNNINITGKAHTLAFNKVVFITA
jgi:hypothetical protein